MNSHKFRQMEDEMNRFEAEISANLGSGLHAPPLLIPHSVKQAAKKNGYELYTPPQVAGAPAVVVSAKPALYVTTPKPPAPAPAEPPTIPAAVDFTILKTEVEKKLKKLKRDKVSADLAISQGRSKASGGLLAGYEDLRKIKGSKNKKLTRVAGGQIWEDMSLTDWQDDDFRIFCGDLGNDVTDELLTRTFNKFPSFIKAKVIRDKRTGKTKGYGFISFKDPADFTRAMKEMNGRYVGSRPIKLRKSTWRNRCVDVVKKKEKEKAVLINMLTSGKS